VMEKRGTPLSIGAFQGGRWAVQPPESTDTGDNEVLHKADDGRRGAECEKQIRREKRNRGEGGKMTEQTEQRDLRVRCLPDGEKTLAPKEYRVRWLSRLQLPLIGFCQVLWYCHRQWFGRTQGPKSVATVWSKDDRVPAKLYGTPTLSNTWPHPVTNGKNTRLHHGLLNWNTTGSAEPELLRSFWFLCIWSLGWCPPMPEPQGPF
jgi:hypothetical protein